MGVKVMADIEYEGWWQLHLRVAKGETLSAQEQESYASGLNQLEAFEPIQLQPEVLNPLRQLRTQWQSLSKTQHHLLAQSAELDKRIVELERIYQQVTGYELATGTYAAR